MYDSALTIDAFDPELAQAVAQRQVRAAVAERNVFEAVERLARQTWIGQHAPVLVPAIEVDGRALDIAHRRRCGCCLLHCQRLGAGASHGAGAGDHQGQRAPNLAILSHGASRRELR